MDSSAFEYAVAATDRRIRSEGDMMFQIGGDAAFEPFDDQLCTAIIELVDKAANAVAELSPRTRRARINLIWKDFVIEQKKLRELAK